MKVNNEKNIIDLSNYINKYKERAPAGKDGSSPAKPEDGVSISQQARDIQAASPPPVEKPEVRAERVAELKRLVESGKYDVDAGKVADSMIKAAIENANSKDYIF